MRAQADRSLCAWRELKGAALWAQPGDARGEAHPAVPLLGQARKKAQGLRPYVGITVPARYSRGTVPPCPSRAEGKQSVVYAYNGASSSLEGRESLTLAAAWMNLEAVTLRETSQPPQENAARCRVREVPGVTSWAGEAGGGLGKMGSRCSTGTEFQFAGKEIPGDGWWRWLSKTVDALNATLTMVKMVNFIYSTTISH